MFCLLILLLLTTAHSTKVPCYILYTYHFSYYIVHRGPSAHQPEARVTLRKKNTQENTTRARPRLVSVIRIAYHILVVTCCPTTWQGYMIAALHQGTLLFSEMIHLVTTHGSRRNTQISEQSAPRVDGATGFLKSFFT
jgi:hypothetical protein